MNKKLSKLFSIFASLLGIIFLIIIFLDYLNYNNYTSFPFYVTIIVRSIEFLLPSFICLIISNILKIKQKKNK